MRRVVTAHKWDRNENDFYVEPSWCSERLFEVEDFSSSLVTDPSCGEGTIVLAARAAGLSAVGYDLVKRGPVCKTTMDFLKTKRYFDSIVSNPPFAIAEEYAKQALRSCEDKVALLLPIVWLTGKTRSTWLETTPLKTVWMLAPRPWMRPGDRPIEKKRGGKRDFCWLVWQNGHRGGAKIRWLRRDG